MQTLETGGKSYNNPQSEPFPFSCEVKSKAGVEAIVLPVELPQVARGVGGNEGKDKRDWTGMFQSQQIDTIPAWGPFYRVAFDLFVNSVPPEFNIARRISAVSTVLKFTKNWYSQMEEELCYQCFQLFARSGKPVLELILKNGHRQTQFRFDQINPEIKKWYKIELERRQLERKVIAAQF